MQETDFERAVIHRAGFTQENSAAHVVVAEFVQSKEFDALHDVRRCVAHIEGNAYSAILSVESSHRVHGTGGKGIDRRTPRLNTRHPQSAQLVYLLLGKGAAFVQFWKIEG